LISAGVKLTGLPAAFTLVTFTNSYA
jgi:hypothetical protein